MHHKDKTILVTGATGRQGGAAARHLIRHWSVRALTRDTGKPKAKALAEMGAQVVAGDLNERLSVVAAMEGCYGVLAVLDYWSAGAEGEVRQGKTLTELASEAAIEHFVYSSVACADRGTGIPHFESKWQIEQHIHRLELAATVIRPVFFMENFASPQFRQAILGGTLRMALHPDRPLQMIAVDDIGAFAALAFDDPAGWKGKAIDIAGDELTGPKIAEGFSKAIGRPVRYEELTPEELARQGEDVAVMFRWFNEQGYDVDIARVRRLHPKLMTFKAWLEAFGWERIAQEAAFGGHA